VLSVRKTLINSPFIAGILGMAITLTAVTLLKIPLTFDSGSVIFLSGVATFLWTGLGNYMGSASKRNSP